MEKDSAEGEKISAWHAAEEHGVDMSAIERNLSLTVRDRIHRHCRALAEAAKLKRASENYRAGS